MKKKLKEYLILNEVSENKPYLLIKWIPKNVKTFIDTVNDTVNSSPEEQIPARINFTPEDPVQLPKEKTYPVLYVKSFPLWVQTFPITYESLKREWVDYLITASGGGKIAGRGTSWKDCLIASSPDQLHQIYVNIASLQMDPWTQYFIKKTGLLLGYMKIIFNQNLEGDDYGTFDTPGYFFCFK